MERIKTKLEKYKEEGIKGSESLIISLERNLKSGAKGTIKPSGWTTKILGYYREDEEMYNWLMRMIDLGGEEREGLRAMEESIGELRGLKGECSESSKKQIRSRISKMFERLEGMDTLSMRKIIERITGDSGEINIEEANKMRNDISTMKLIVNNIKENRFKESEEEQRRMLEEAGWWTREVVEELEEEQEMKEEEYIEWEEIEKRLEEYEREKGKKWTEREIESYINVRLQVRDNAPRRNEYSKIRIDGEGKNRYEEGKIKLGEYKTVEQYGEYEFELSEETKEKVEILRERKKRKGGKWLFGEGEEPENWTRRTKEDFKRIIGVEITSRMLRKSYITHLTRRGELTYIEDQRRLARAMGHSVYMQQRIYVKHEPKGVRERRTWTEEEEKRLKEVLEQMIKEGREIKGYMIKRRLEMKGYKMNRQAYAIEVHIEKKSKVEGGIYEEAITKIKTGREERRKKRDTRMNRK